MTQGYLYVCPPTDSNNSVWMTALETMFSEIVQNALDNLSGTGIATRVVNAYSAGLAGELVETAVELTFEIQSDPDIVKLLDDWQEKIAQEAEQKRIAESLAASKARAAQDRETLKRHGRSFNLRHRK